MKKPIVLFVTLLITVALGACGGEAIVDRLFTYQGVVLDSASTTPLDSVEVVVGDTLQPRILALTDSLGEYRLDLFGAGTSQLTFRRQGYRTQIVSTSTNTNVFVDSLVVLLAK